MTELTETDTAARMHQYPEVDEGARAWAMAVPYDGSGLEGEALRRWQWGWLDADQGYRAYHSKLAASVDG